MLLVTRREAAADGMTAFRRYLHLSTGNDNARTARLYTDIGYLSADPELTAAVDAVFQQLASLSRLKPQRQLLTAPFRLHRRMLDHVHDVAAAARTGRPGRIVIKCNALTDPALISALADASQAGAQIDLIVRGACLLPGLPGVTDTVRVRSIVGRFLEHSRIYFFSWDDDDDSCCRLYLSSADWMSRNMFGRIELAWPVRDPKLRQRVIDECLVPYLHDGHDAWTLQADGHYRRAASQGPSAQAALLAKHAEVVQ